MRRIPGILTAVMILNACANDARPVSHDGDTSAANNVALLGDTTHGCESCATALTLVGTYGGSKDTLLLRSIPRLQRMSNGALLAYVYRATHPILLYNVGEQPIAIGKPGGGPGEYQHVEGISVAVGDSIVVSHDSHRVSIFDQSGKYIRSTPVEPALQGAAILTQNNRIMVVATQKSPAGASLPLHLLDEKGAVIKSLGRPAVFAGMTDLAVSNQINGRVWVADVASNYRLDEISESAEVATTIVSKAPSNWQLGAFLNRHQFDSTFKGVKPKNISKAMRGRPIRMPVNPPSKVTGLFSSTNEIGISFVVPADDFKDVELQYPASTNAEASSQPREDVQLKLYQTAIDRIDHRTMKLVDRFVVPGYGMLLNDGTLALIRSDADGVFWVELFRLRSVKL